MMTIFPGERLDEQGGATAAQVEINKKREAELANDVAENIQHIFAVTEQTGEGTRATAQQVRELSQVAEELRQSVSRFKIA